MPTFAPCPVCGFFGGMIANPGAVISMVGMPDDLTCAGANNLGLNNTFTNFECEVIQGVAIAFDTCGCTGAITPEPTVQPTPAPTPDPTPFPTTATPTAVPTRNPTPGKIDPMHSGHLYSTYIVPCIVFFSAFCASH